MKKINFEKLSDSDMFGKFASNQLSSNQVSTLKGGTSTALCKTTETWDDKDYQGDQETLGDKRCSGY
jgi:hypothetical protein